MLYLSIKITKGGLRLVFEFRENKADISAIFRSHSVGNALITGLKTNEKDNLPGTCLVEKNLLFDRLVCTRCAPGAYQVYAGSTGISPGLPLDERAPVEHQPGSHQARTGREKKSTWFAPGMNFSTRLTPGSYPAKTRHIPGSPGWCQVVIFNRQDHTRSVPGSRPVDTGHCVRHLARAWSVPGLRLVDTMSFSNHQAFTWWVPGWCQVNTRLVPGSYLVSAWRKPGSFLPLGSYLVDTRQMPGSRQVHTRFMPGAHLACTNNCLVSTGRAPGTNPVCTRQE